MFFPVFAFPGDDRAGMGRLYILPDEAKQETTIRGDSILLPSFSPDTVWVSTHEHNIRFILAEDSLRMMALEIVHPAEDSLRLANNDRFTTYLKEVIGREGGMRYAFDSLATVSFLMPPDGSFRIITWYVPLSEQRFRYFGLVQVAGYEADAPADAQSGVAADAATREGVQPGADPSHEKQKIYVLHELAGFHGEDDAGAFAHDRWYGSWYYDLVTEHHAGEAHYVLLGWRADRPDTRKRVIEPFALQDGGPVFGSPVFDLLADLTGAAAPGLTGRRGMGAQIRVPQPEILSQTEQPYRIVFEYSVRVSMGLLHDTQPVRQGQEAVPMIVFDRLEPLEEAFRGQREFYVPEGNIFDAFLFREGRWVLVRDVDARKK